MASKQFQPGDITATLTERQSLHDPLKQELRLQVVTGLPVDRTEVAAWCFDSNPKGRALAERLKRCISAGRAFAAYEVLTDVNGKTYVSAEQAEFFHGRHMNTSLRTLGF